MHVDRILCAICWPGCFSSRANHTFVTRAHTRGCMPALMTTRTYVVSAACLVCAGTELRCSSNLNLILGTRFVAQPLYLITKMFNPELIFLLFHFITGLFLFLVALPLHIHLVWWLFLGFIASFIAADLAMSSSKFNCLKFILEETKRKRSSRDKNWMRAIADLYVMDGELCASWSKSTCALLSIEFHCTIVKLWAKYFSIEFYITSRALLSIKVMNHYNSWRITHNLWYTLSSAQLINPNQRCLRSR